jgi:hypothetical protein
MIDVLIRVKGFLTVFCLLAGYRLIAHPQRLPASAPPGRACSFSHVGQGQDERTLGQHKEALRAPLLIAPARPGLGVRTTGIPHRRGRGRAARHTSASHSCGWVRSAPAMGDCLGGSVRQLLAFHSVSCVAQTPPNLGAARLLLVWLCRGGWRSATPPQSPLIRATS